MDEKKKGKSIETKKITSVSQNRTSVFCTDEIWTCERTMRNKAEQFLLAPRRSPVNTFISFMKVNSVYTSQSSQPAAVARGLVPLAMATDEMNFETSTASLFTTLEVATSSKHFQVKSLFSRVSICLTSSSSNLTKHSSKIS